MKVFCAACQAGVTLLPNERVVRTCPCPSETGVVVSLTAVLTGEARVASDPKPESPEEV